MRNVGFIGYGNLGKQIHALLAMAGKLGQIYLFDDLLYESNAANSYRFSAFLDEEFRDLDFYVCLGYKHLNSKRDITEVLARSGRSLPFFVHETAFVNPSARIGHGSIIYPLCNVDRNVVVGSGVLLNNSVTISHDNNICDCSYLSPGVTTSGYVRVGECTFIGTGVLVSNNIRIGDNAKIGIGTVVSKDIPDNRSCIGNPMRFLEQKLEVQ